MRYRGKIKSGLGEGKYWIEKAKEIFKKKYNMHVFLGTFNIELEEDYILEDDDKILPYEYGGDFEVLVNECRINGYKGLIVRPEKNNLIGGDHPLNIIEVVSDINFREELNLNDGDEVEVEI